MEIQRAAVWAGAILLVLFTALVVWRWMESRVEVDQPTAELDRQALVARIDSLQGIIKRKDSLLQAQPGLTEWDVRRLQRRGLAEPRRQLVDSLMERPGLIPYEGVVGGTMAFRRPQVTILSGRWVFAGFDDGHIAGKMLLEYTVADGEVSWEVVDSYRE